MSGFVKLATTTLLAMGLSLPALVQATEARELRFSIFLPDTSALTRGIMKPFADKVAEESNGDLTVTIFANSVLGGPADQLEIVESQVAELALIFPFAYPGVFPITDLASMPFAFDNATHGVNVMEAMLDDYLTKEFSSVHPLFVNVASASAVQTRTRPVQSYEDMAGLRVGSGGGMQNAVLEAIGASVVTMASNDYYMSIERGVIDGTLLPLGSSSGYKLEEVLRYATPLNFSATPSVVAINSDVWNELTDEQKAAIERAAAWAQESVGQMFDDMEAEGRQLLSDNGVEFSELTADEMGKFLNAANPQWQGWVDNANLVDGLEAEQVMARFKDLIEELRP